MLFYSIISTNYTFRMDTNYDHDNNKLKYIYLVIMIACVTSLVCIRYIGVIFYLLLVFVFYHTKNKKHFFPYFLVANFVYGVVVWLFFLNKFVTQFLSKFVITINKFMLPTNHVGTQNNYLWVNIIDLFKSIKEMLPSLNLRTYLTITVVAAIIAIINWKRNQNYQTHDNYIRNISIKINLFLSILYLASTIVLLTHAWGASGISHYEDSMDIRFLSVVFPLIWISLFLFFEHQRAHTFFSLGLGILIMWVALTFTIKGFSSLLSIHHNWKIDNTPMLSNGLNDHYNNFTFPISKNPYKQVFSKLTENNSVIVIDKPEIFQFLTEIKSVRLPSDFTLPAIQELNSLPKNSYIVFFIDDRLRMFTVFINENGLKVNGIKLGDEFVVIKLPIKL